MITKEAVINNQVGLHARPATFFIQKANEFKSSIWIEKDERRVNAKSLLGVLSLGIVKGTAVTLVADGADEEEAIDTLVALINYDVQEIHSTGLEYMMTAHYGEMLAADDAEAYVEYELVNGLYAVITGCLYDEFQRKVYDSEDPLDRAAINDAFEELVAEYGCENLFDRYDWAYVTHTFDSPLYYISYAVSSVSSLELWDISRTDPEGAVRMWKSVLLSDDAVQSYWEIMEEAGLTDIFEGDNAADICGVVLEALDKGTAVSRKAA